MTVAASTSSPTTDPAITAIIRRALPFVRRSTGTSVDIPEGCSKSRRSRGRSGDVAAPGGERADRAEDHGVGGEHQSPLPPVERGRAAAHAGVELLLDGVLLDDPDATATFGEVWTRLGDPDATVVTVVAAGDRPRWREWLAVLTTELDPAGYGRPEVVARRLERLLARRPRLALAAGDRAVVADALRAVRDRVHEVGPTLVAEVSAAARVAPAG